MAIAVATFLIALAIIASEKLHHTFLEVGIPATIISIA